jgi:ribulose-5-phosphate 4-epimerase/fuculose-1-phosphate aldolase
MRYEYLHPRDELVLTMQRIYRYKMTTTSGGNLSIRDENGVMVVGESVLSAFDKLEVLEHSAEAVLDAQPIGGHVAMSQEIIDDLIDAFHLERTTPHGANP